MNRFIGIFFVSLIISFNCLADFNWFQGPVEQAFKQARELNKPMFLYWGAVWCPPCNQMKKTVFTRQEFQQAMQGFVAVYLDGDTKEAQIWGEKLKGQGYPTMLVLNSQGKELMRMPTGLSSEKYIDLLNQVLKSGKDIDQLAQLALKGQTTADDWKVIAGYSWAQHPDLKDGNKLLVQLWKKAPTQREKSRLLTQLLSDFTPDALETEMIASLGEIFKQPDLTLDSLEPIVWGVSKLVHDKLTGAEAKRLKDDLLASLEKLRQQDLSLSQRLITYYPQVVFSVPKIAETIKQEVKKVDSEAKDPYSRQSAMSDAIYLLMQTDQLDLAHKYATQELSKGQSPFYFMSYLGSIEQKRKNNKAALEWHRKAWQAAIGDAAQFQWGTSYIIQAMKLTPKNHKEITSDLTAMLDQVLKQKDAFYGRNLKRMQKLSAEVKNWQQQNKAAHLPDFCINALDKQQCKQMF